MHHNCIDKKKTLDRVWGDALWLVMKNGGKWLMNPSTTRAPTRSCPIVTYLKCFKQQSEFAKVAPWAKTINVFRACLGAHLTICAQKWRNLVLFSTVSLRFVLSQICVFLYSLGPLSPSTFNIFLEQTKTNALDKGMTLKMWCYTTGGNNLEHTVTNEAVKQRIWYLICVYATLLESFVGRNVNGLTLHTNRKPGLLAHGVMHGMSEESEEIWE